LISILPISGVERVAKDNSLFLTTVARRLNLGLGHVRDILWIYTGRAHQSAYGLKMSMLRQSQSFA
jgi:hypothetical protein